MRSLLHLSLISFVGLGLTGCIKISGNDSFQPDGSFISETNFDFSAMLEMTEGLEGLGDGLNEATQDGGMEVDGNGLDEFCKTAENEIEGDKRYMVESFECTETDKGIFYIRIEGKTRSDYLSIKNGVYTLLMNNSDLEIDLDGITGDTADGGSAEEGLTMMQSMGMDFTQTYTFPVPVTHTDVGRIEGNKVIIELADFMKIGEQLKLGQKSEFKIVAGERKRTSIRHQRSKGNKRLQRYHRQYLTSGLYKKQSSHYPVQPKVKKVSTRRTSARNQLSSRLRMKGNARRVTKPTQSRETKTYYHPFADKKGRGYRGSRR